MTFCPKCGVSIERGQTFCDEHRPNKLDIKPFEIRVCSCGRVFARNRWFLPHDIKDSVLKFARDHIKQRVPLELKEFTIPLKRGQKTKGLIIATYEGEEFPIAFAVKHQRCDKCAKLGTHYFTAKLQLRDPPAEALPFVESYVAPLAEKGVSINNVEDTPRGPDLFLTHKAVARQLGEKLTRKFGGTMKQSEQLFSRNKQTSKNLFRLNVLVQFAHFSVGDVVSLEKKAVLVTGLGKQCTGRDLSLDKKVVFTAGDEEEVLKKYKTTVAVTKPELSIIHPLTFQQVIPSNHKSMLGEYKDGQKVKVVVMDKKLFLL